MQEHIWGDPVQGSPLAQGPGIVTVNQDKGTPISGRGAGGRQHSPPGVGAAQSHEVGHRL